ncbi:pyrroline-5-carboxylate reductase [Pandoraea thiooxydans]|uniref:Pyrroline-5-carboxylate reductase n=1 Tax=Pandoraea thiooxydans TaxID=445709 RepID=A0A0G3EZ85_9BURK|nr:pyrroline-5-carboxylate reductase [Pandoraea thiooxydans]AKJ70031.1 pyrroline-5-carboxylate reductase [Pandoraea thiooxydans]APR93446.1 pyrroline-5-carboxylate reductase [Pandoraea thiooxydans]
MKIAFIGGGNMAGALIGGLLRQGVPATDLSAVDLSPQTCEHLTKTFGINAGTQLSERLRDQEAIVLAVKPQHLKEAAQSLAPYLRGQLVISIAAGVHAAVLSRWLGGYDQIVRCMPNTPALVGKGISGLAALSGVDTSRRQLAERVLKAAGQVIWCDNEAQLDGVTALSGSGPAYVFYFIEAMQQAAAELGFSEAQGRQLAIATVAGAAELAAQSSEPASVLRERVTSKGGTTFAALTSFEHDGVKAAIVRGIHAAHARSRELGAELGAD